MGTMEPPWFGDQYALKAADQWPSRPPRDLAVRLADALQYEQCGPLDLWDEICDWLNMNKVAPPTIHPMSLVPKERDAVGSRKFLPISQKGSDMNITRLIYTSKHEGLAPAVLDKILQKSRANNVRDHVTGALIVGENHFMQLIEGGRVEISRCLLRIMQDQSHYDIQIITCGDVAHRLFQEWSMHFIMASRIKEEILNNYRMDGVFTPSLMSEFAIEDLCRTLARGNWDAEAA